MIEWDESIKQKLRGLLAKSVRELQPMTRDKDGTPRCYPVSFNVEIKQRTTAEHAQQKALILEFMEEEMKNYPHVNYMMWRQKLWMWSTAEEVIQQ